jgi:alkylation response protein AidB-like acyl-CoA dehydrogenase
VRFAFTDEQLAFRDALRGMLDDLCAPDVVRAAWTSDTGRTEKLWTLLDDMGAFDVEEVELALVLTETGRAALPEPVLEHAAVGVPALREAGVDVAPGSVVTVGFVEAPLVPYADTADVLVLERGGVLHAVDPATASLERRPSVDGSRRLFDVSWDTGTALAADRELAFDRGALGAAAQLVGLGERVLAMAVGYAAEREQFGVKIGTFQAVQHQLADARIALEFARPAVTGASGKVAHRDGDRSTSVSLAKARASDAASLACRAALQVHGAIGYTTEHDLHLFMKRVWGLAAAWGDARFHRARIGRAIL